MHLQLKLRGFIRHRTLASYFLGQEFAPKEQIKGFTGQSQRRPLLDEHKPKVRDLVGSRGFKGAPFGNFEVRFVTIHARDGIISR